MNKSYISVWNEASGSWVAASENTMARGKRSKSRVLAGGAVLVLGTIVGYSGEAGATAANPLPTYGNIVFGAESGSKAATASAGGSIAIGTGAAALGTNAGTASSSIAIGSSATAGAASSIAIGDATLTSGVNSAALGPGSTTSSANSVALGSFSTVTLTGTNSVALGYASVADRANTVSVGTAASQRQLVNVAAGTQASDAVNVTQLGNVVNALGGGATINADGSITAPVFNMGGSTQTNVGSALTALNNSGTRYFKTGGISDGTDDATVIGYSVAIGAGSKAVNTGGYSSIAIGKNATTSYGGNLAIGENATANGGDSAAIGRNASTVNIGGANGQIAFGNAASTGAGRAIALGASANATVTSSMALGASASATAINSVALGASSTTTAILSTMGYNPGSTALSGTASTANGEVSVGSATKERRVTNVAAGAAATDAVNVSQLTSEAAKSNALGTNVANALGGGASYNVATGTFSAPVYTVDGKTVSSVGEAVSNIDGRTVANTSAIGALDTRVTTAEDDIEKNTTDIAGNTTAISSLDTRVGTAEDSIVKNTTDIAGNTTAIGALDTRVGTAEDSIVKNTTDIAGNTTAIGALDTRVGTAEDSIVKNTTDIAGNTTAISALDTRVGTAEDTIVKNTTDIATNASAISDVQGSVSNLAQQLSSGSVGLVKQDAETKAITVASATGGTSVDFTGTAGARTLSGVKGGKLEDGSTEAVNGSQLAATNDRMSTAEGNITQNTADIAGNTTAISALDTRVGTAEDTIVKNTTDIVGNTTAIGALDTRVGTAEDSIVKNTTDIAGNTTAIGALDTRVGTAEDSIVKNTTDIATNASAISDVQGSVSNLAQQLSSGSVGLVKQDAETKAITVASATGGTSVDFTGTDGARTLRGVKDGKLEDGSTEAVNGSQLAETNDRVSTAEGNITQNTTDIAKNTTDIATNASAISDVESSVSTLTQQLGSGSVGLVQQDADKKAITVASATGGTSVDFTGTDGVRTLSGVKDGKLEAGSTEAVNGSQLAATNDRVSTAEGNIAHNTSDIAGNTLAISGLDTRVGTAEDNIAKNTSDIAGNTANLAGLMNGSVGLVQQTTANGNVTIGSGVGGKAVDVAGTDGTRVLTGVANGIGDTDAVTIAQLKAVGLVDQNGQTLNALVYDDLTYGRATLGGTNGTVIGNLANGLVAANSMEAVNGGQLYALQEQFKTQYDQLNNQYDQLSGQVIQLNSQVTVLSGRVEDYATGPGNPVLPGTGANSTAVGSNAIASGDNSAVLGSGAAATGNGSTAVGTGTIASGTNSTGLGSNATASGDNSTALGANSSATGSNSVALGQGSVADRDNTVSVGSAGNERQITNVAAGTAPTDAVNLGQVNDLLSQGMAQGVQQSNSYTDQRFDQANHAINQVARSAYAGVAAAMAMPNMTPSGPGRTIVAAGAGNYKNGSALAAGVTYRSQGGNWLMNGAISVTSTGDAGVRAQVGYEF